MKKWYQKPAPYDDIVLSSRIRLARNLATLPFAARITKEQRRQVFVQVKEALQNIQFGENKLTAFSMEEMTPMQRGALVEKHLISRELIRDIKERYVILSENESISIMVNEEDHLRIQLIENGLQLQEAYQLGNRIDDVLDESLSYAFEERLGYLTTCPTNLGTGLRASVMMHLPALEQSGLISQLISTVSKLGLTIRGTYGEGSQVIGSLYQVSNQITLGITEQDAIENLQRVVLQIIEQEKKVRENLLENPLQLEDAVYRKLGMLQSARLLGDGEFFDAVSKLRLGVSMGLTPSVSYALLNELMQTTSPSVLQTGEEKTLSRFEQEAKRAKLVRERLSEHFA